MQAGETTSPCSAGPNMRYTTPHMVCSRSARPLLVFVAVNVCDHAVFGACGAKWVERALVSDYEYSTFGLYCSQ